MKHFFIMLLICGLSTSCGAKPRYNQIGCKTKKECLRILNNPKHCPKGFVGKYTKHTDLDAFVAHCVKSSASGQK